MGAYHPPIRPTVADVERIAATADPAVRNLQITQCYHELACVLATRTGVQANWCTFATWASKQAGQSIRKEDLDRLVEDVWDGSPATRELVDDLAVLLVGLGAAGGRVQIRRAIWQLLDPSGAIEHTSQAVAEGNVKVFAEIGREFARFYTSCLDDETWQAERIDAFCAGLRPGDPPDGQGLLRQAFGQIYAALFELDAKLAAERLFLANVLIGCHEQNRLQPEIAAAVDAPFMDGSQFVRRLLVTLFPRTAWVILRAGLAMQRLLGRRPLLDVMAEALLERTHRQTRLAITELMMTITFPPDMRLRLGRDLSGEYPAALRELTFAELGAMLESVDPTPDSLSESGAADWASLPDRLHFIVELFRLYHEAGDLFTPPFTAEQVAALKEGWLPDGRL